MACCSNGFGPGVLGAARRKARPPNSWEWEGEAPAEPPLKGFSTASDESTLKGCKNFVYCTFTRYALRVEAAGSAKMFTFVSVPGIGADCRAPVDVME